MFAWGHARIIRLWSGQIGGCSSHCLSFRCGFAFVLQSTFSCVAFKLLGKCCRPRRVGTERERMSGQMRRAENVNAIHWGNQKQRQRQVQVKTVPKICQCSVALGHAICKGFPSGQCCLCLAATPRSPSLDCQLCAQN